MKQPEETIKNRQKTLVEIMGGVVPRVWCPPLTHYRSNGELNKDRMADHWAFMIPHVNAFLIPGSTSDGWEMTDDEVSSLLNYALELAQTHGAHLLIGVLKTNATAMCETISNTVEILKERSGSQDTIEALKQSKVCGFTICPPRGPDLTQDDIEIALKHVLDLGLPTAFYQLPQITGNEISPRLVAELAAAYPNLLFLKDSSGKDSVALEDSGRTGIWFMRGAEGDYAKWLKESGGPYNGLLVSAANCFAEQLDQLVNWLEEGLNEEAFALSKHLTGVLFSILEIAGKTEGNPFANANRAIDHFMGHGQGAEKNSPPRLRNGKLMSEKMIHEVGRMLNRADLVPERGYLDHSL